MIWRNIGKSYKRQSTVAECADKTEKRRM